MERLYHQIMDVLRSTDVEYTQIWTAFLTLFWGIGLTFVPVGVLDVDPALIGALMILAAMVEFYGVSRLQYYPRRAGALSAIMLWATVAALSLDSRNAWSIVIVATAAYAGANSFWNYHRIGLKRDFRARMMEFRDLKD